MLACRSQPGQIKPNVALGMAGTLREFLNALRTGVTPVGDFHHNIKSLAMVFGAIESSQSGRRVSVPTR